MRHLHANGRDLLAGVDLAGRIVTADAMHTQTETARLIVGGGADYLLTAKDNQTEMLDDIRAIDWARAAAAAPSNSTKPSTATRCCPDAARRSASSASGT